MTTWTAVLCAVLVAVLGLWYRTASRAGARELLLRLERDLYKQIVTSGDLAEKFEASASEHSRSTEPFADLAANSDSEIAASWRSFERERRERLERFRAVRLKCEEERMDWEKVVRVLHENGLYEDAQAKTGIGGSL